MTKTITTKQADLLSGMVRAGFPENAPVKQKLTALLTLARTQFFRAKNTENASEMTAALDILNLVPLGLRFDEFLEHVSCLGGLIDPELEEFKAVAELTIASEAEKSRKAVEDTARVTPKLGMFVGASSKATLSEVSELFRQHGRREIARHIDDGHPWQALKLAERLLGDARASSKRFATALKCSESAADISNAIDALDERVREESNDEKTQAASLLRSIWWGDLSFSESRFSQAHIATR